MSQDVFIWTEAYNCGEILNPMLSSYLQHHNLPIHIFLTKHDFEEVAIESDLIIPVFLDKDKFISKSKESKILDGYKKGHLGTARLWDYLINSRKENVFVHLDADTIFIGEALKEIIEAINYKGYAIAGSRRAYRERGYRKKGLDSALLNLRPDTVNTDCFSFNKKKIRKHPRFILRRKIRGRRVSLFPVVDFFDPVTFQVINGGGNILYVDSPNEGNHSTLNTSSRFISSRISFAAVGSGCNFYKNGSKGIPVGYAQYALQSYSLFASEFLNKEIGVRKLDDKVLLGQLEKLDKIRWVLN